MWRHRHGGLPLGYKCAHTLSVWAQQLLQSLHWWWVWRWLKRKHTAQLQHPHRTPYPVVQTAASPLCQHNDEIKISPTWQPEVPAGNCQNLTPQKKQKQAASGLAQPASVPVLASSSSMDGCSGEPAGLTSLSWGITVAGFKTLIWCVAFADRKRHREDFWWENIEAQSPNSPSETHTVPVVQSQK